jgi:hypothetical protein
MSEKTEPTDVTLERYKHETIVSNNKNITNRSKQETSCRLLEENGKDADIKDRRMSDKDGVEWLWTSDPGQVRH